MSRAFRIAPSLLLVAITAIWGWTFVIVRDAVHTYPVLPFLALRFAVAALFLAPALRRGGRDVAYGLPPGIALAAGYWCQTLGLRYTTASKAGLLTGLMVVMTPLLEWLVYRRRPAGLTLAAVTVAFAGTALLALGGENVWVKPQELLGDGLEVLTALCFAIHILVLSKLPATVSAIRVALGQMSVAALAFGLGAGISGGIPAPSPAVWWAILITGGLASALAFWVQTLVQQRISPSRTALVLVMEPAFATFFGFLLANDRFSPVQAVGGLSILAALVLHEAAPTVLRYSRTRWAGT